MAHREKRDAASRSSATGPDGAPRPARLPGEDTGRPRVADRWMGELIRLASWPPTEGRNSAHPSPIPSSADLPVHLQARLEQAIRWGYQERELRQFEASLMRRATVGEFLSWARERRGLSLQEVGALASFPEEHLHSLEKGRLSPLDVAPEQMARLVRTLDLSIWTVLERLRPESQRGEATVFSTSERFFPHGSARLSPDDVWSAGARRRSVRSRPLALRDSSQLSTDTSRWTGYLKALWQAWRCARADSSQAEEPPAGNPESTSA